MAWRRHQLSVLREIPHGFSVAAVGGLRPLRNTVRQAAVRSLALPVHLPRPPLRRPTRFGVSGGVALIEVG